MSIVSGDKTGLGTGLAKGAIAPSKIKSARFPDTEAGQNGEGLPVQNAEAAHPFRQKSTEG